MILFLVAVTLCSTNYTAANASFGWGGYTVKNRAEGPIVNPPSKPYQVIEDVAPLSMNGYFDFSNNASCYVTTYVTKCFQDVQADYTYVRADSDKANLVNLAFTGPAGMDAA